MSRRTDDIDGASQCQHQNPVQLFRRTRDNGEFSTRAAVDLLLDLTIGKGEQKGRSSILIPEKKKHGRMYQAA